MERGGFPARVTPVVPEVDLPSEVDSPPHLDG